MRPIGTSAQLAERRERALTLLQHGYITAQVAKVVRVTPRSVQRWRESRPLRNRRKPTPRPAHRPCRLSPRQLKQLEQTLLRGALASGYAEDYWTLERVAKLIAHRFGIQYRSSAVWYLLRRMGWSCQKPQRVSFQHDEAVIARWKRYIWPKIKKVVLSEGNPCISRRKWAVVGLSAQAHLVATGPDAQDSDQHSTQ